MKPIKAIGFSWSKLVINLLIVLSLVSMGIAGYYAFSHRLQPIVGTVGFLVFVVLFICLVCLANTKAYKWRKPTFGIVFWSLVGISLIATFAGVEPLNSYKDTAFVGINKWWTIATVPRTPTATPIPPTTPTIPKTTTTPTPTATPTLEQPPKPPKPEQPAPLIITITPIKPPTPTIIIPTLTIENIERQAFDLINQERVKAGLQPTIWDDKLYKLSKAHTEDMANKGTLFHTPTGAGYGENAWGASWGGTNKSSLASEMVNSWMSSPLHKAWILHIPLKTSVVSIVDDNRGQFASWTFYMLNDGGPPLIQKAYNMWQAETGGRIDWITWLYNVKGYPDNQDFLKQLGIK